MKIKSAGLLSRRQPLTSSSRIALAPRPDNEQPMRAATVLIPAVPAAGVACAPLAQADPGGQAGLSKPFSVAGGPFIGEWGAHGERVTVTADGSGVETSRYGTTNFSLGSVQTSTNPWDTAYGN